MCWCSFTSKLKVSAWKGDRRTDWLTDGPTDRPTCNGEVVRMCQAAYAGRTKTRNALVFSSFHRLHLHRTYKRTYVRRMGDSDRQKFRHILHSMALVASGEDEASQHSCSWFSKSYRSPRYWQPRRCLGYRRNRHTDLLACPPISGACAPSHGYLRGYYFITSIFIFLCFMLIYRIKQSGKRSCKEF